MTALKLISAFDVVPMDTTLIPLRILITMKSTIEDYKNDICHHLSTIVLIKPITTMVNTYIFIMINDITMISYSLTYPSLPDPPIMARRQGGGEGPASYQGDHDGAKVVVMAPR